MKDSIALRALKFVCISVVAGAVLSISLTGSASAGGPAECSPSCTGGEYCDTSSSEPQCLMCHPSCATCSGPDPDDCDSCDPGYRVEGNMCVDIDECATNNGDCGPPEECTCNNTDGGRECLQVDGCVGNPCNEFDAGATCSDFLAFCSGGPGGPEPLIPVAYFCTCSPGFYNDGTTCQPCDPGYVSGPGATMCDACLAGEFEVDNTRCDPCPAGSVSLQGEDECTECSSGTFTTDNLTCPSCSTTCPTGLGQSAPCIPQANLECNEPCPFETWNDGSLLTCQACSSCVSGQYESVQCSPSSDTVCADCGNGGAMYGCPTGEYKDGTACDGSGPSDTQTCATCDNGGAAYTCGTGEYQNGTACDGGGTSDTQTCATCDNGGAAYTCAAGEYQDGTACDGGRSDTQTCTACGNGGASYSCSSGQYKDGTECVGSGSSDTQSCTACQTCSPGEFQSGTLCDGNGTSDTQTCTSCDVSCAECTGPGPESCTSCASGYVPGPAGVGSASTGGAASLPVCVPDCSDLGDCHGHGICTAPGDCTCDAGWTEPACLNCDASFFCNGNGTCDNASGACTCDAGWTGASCGTCDAGYFGPSCLPCDPACLECMGPTNEDCVGCAPGYETLPPDPVLPVGASAAVTTETCVALPDHYQCYKTRAEGAPKLDVTLADQFGTFDAIAEKLENLCTPVRKNGEGNPDLNGGHLTCYKLKDAPKPPSRFVLVENQFGPLELQVKEPKALCLPAVKDIGAPPSGDPAALNANHFLCYKAGAVFKDDFTVQVVTLEDQFESREAAARKPVALCNPVDKNSEGTIVDPENHLVCYELNKHEALGLEGVFTSDQFGDLESTVYEPKTLCVPSTKTVFPE